MTELTFNFVGVNAVDFRRAFAFYTEVVGVRPAEPTPPDDPDSWAMLVAGWDDSSVPEGSGLRCELFEQDVEPPDERRWGRHQNVRPSIQVADLSASRATLHERSVSFTGDLEDTDGRQSIEFTGPEGVRWSLAHAPAYPAAQSVRTPYLGWVELKAANLDRQQDFYTRIMGLSVGERSASRVRLEQDPGDPLLFIEPGGEPVSTDGEHDSPFDVQPVWLSFETPDITEAAAWLTECGVSLLQDVTHHDWGGTDITIEDADGNPLQVVEYHDE